MNRDPNSPLPATAATAATAKDLRREIIAEMGPERRGGVVWRKGLVVSAKVALNSVMEIEMGIGTGMYGHT